MPQFIIYNDGFFDRNTPLIPVSNRAFKYGEGVFETVRLANGKLCFFELHMKRLFHALQLLKFSLPSYFTSEFMQSRIHKLLEKNGHQQFARVRLSVFRGSEDFFQYKNFFPNYIIESSFLVPSSGQQKGLTLGVFGEGSKNTDKFSNLKSNQYLLSTMSNIDAGEKDVDENILLNCYGRVCETSKANIFCIHKGQILTPPLAEGCVDGVIRRFILENPHLFPLPVQEKILTKEDLFKADEVFLTNAIQPVRWVQRFDEKQYSCIYSNQILSAILGSF